MKNTIQALSEILKEHGYILEREDRSHNVAHWPTDERGAYRDNGGFGEGSKAVEELRLAKVAAELDKYVDAVRTEADANNQIMHLAFRPDVTAEVCVQLSEDADWDAIAKWCGGYVVSTTVGDTGEYQSSIVFGQGEDGVPLQDDCEGYASEDMWITKNLKGEFGSRLSVSDPDGDTLRVAQWQVIRKLPELWPVMTRDMVGRHEVKQWLEGISDEVKKGRTL